MLTNKKKHGPTDTFFVYIYIKDTIKLTSEEVKRNPPYKYRTEGSCSVPAIGAPYDAESLGSSSTAFELHYGSNP